MEKEESENPRIRCELTSWKAGVTKLVIVVTDQFELRKCYGRLKRIKDSATQKKSPRSRGEGGRKNPDDDNEVISRLQQNIQMNVEKMENTEVHQLQFPYQMADELLRRNDDCLKFRSGEHH